jgi:hypothetical protein
MKHEVFFRKHPVFTGEELAEHLSTSGKVGSRTQEALLCIPARKRHHSGKGGILLRTASSTPDG